MRGLQDFAGEWQITRRIVEASGASARFTGSATLTPNAHGLAYTERGTLHLAEGAPMTAERRYLWRAGAGGRIAILFADGRPFHDFDPAARGPEARHLCDPDTYDVRYDFTGWPLWRAIWTVRGPRKDYRMESLYQR